MCLAIPTKNRLAAAAFGRADVSLLAQSRAIYIYFRLIVCFVSISRDSFVVHNHGVRSMQRPINLPPHFVVYNAPRRSMSVQINRNAAKRCKLRGSPDSLHYYKGPFCLRHLFAIQLLTKVVTTTKNHIFPLIQYFQAVFARSSMVDSWKSSIHVVANKKIRDIYYYYIVHSFKER